VTGVRARRVSRPGRRGARGQSLAVVALGGVALIGMSGLALDGGYEVGVYRNAQNGADAGALAAARTIYEDQANPTYATSDALCKTSTPYGVGPQQVHLNNTNPTVTCTPKTLTTYAPYGADGFHSYGALATVDASQSVKVLGINVATLASHIGVNEATGDVTANPNPAASGSVDLASLSASLTSISNSLLSTSGSADVFQCSSSASGAGTSSVVPGAGGSCPGSSLALTLTLAGLVSANVDTALGLTGNIATNPAGITLVKQALSSVVPTSGMAQQRDSTQAVGASLGLLSTVTINANAGTTTTTTGNLGGDTTGAKASTNVANVSATIAGTSISLTGMDVGAQVSYDPVNGFQATTSCTYLSGEGTSQTKVTYLSSTTTITAGANCNYTPITIPGVLTIGPTRSVSCTPTAHGEYCSATVCAFDVNVLSLLSGISSIDVCIGKAQATADFLPQTQTGGVIVTSQVPSPTFFLGVVGAHTTHPKATAAATPRQVTDVSSAAFAGAPYAVPYDATEQSGGASYCTGSYGALVPGCNYIVWGSGIDYNTAMDTQLSCGSGTSCWQGQLDPSSSHALGQTVTAKSGAGGGPSPVLSGGKYILLPVISDEGVVVQYGLFTATANSKIYTLARTPDPVNSVTSPIAQSETTAAWMPNDEGAVSVKLVDPTYFNATGWS
jgi:hypothetical protein